MAKPVPPPQEGPSGGDQNPLPSPRIGTAKGALAEGEGPTIPRALLNALIEGIFGIKTAEAAAPGPPDPTNPSAAVIPFPRSPLGEGGGGGIRPPQRFQEIMRQAPVVERPAAQNPLAPAQAQAPRDFLSRRQAQLDKERMQAAKAEEMRMDEGVAKARAEVDRRRMERQQSAVEWVQKNGPGRPRENTPELGEERALGAALGEPAVSSRGFVLQPVVQPGGISGTLYTNAKTGATRLSAKPTGGEGLQTATVDIPFVNRREALLWLRTIGKRPLTQEQLIKEAEVYRGISGVKPGSGDAFLE